MTWTEAKRDTYLQRDTNMVGGIPRYAQQEDDEFDKRWEKHRKPQATSQFWKTLVDPSQLTGKVVLDAGCGIGRYSREALNAGAAELLAVDISDHAVEQTAKLCPESLVLQADLLDLPIVPRTVDFAFSIGVVHHTPNPARAFAQIAATVKPGGMFAVWMYARETDPAVAAAMELLHAITSICPREELHQVFEKHACKLRDLYNKQWEPLQRVLRISNSKDAEECVSDTYDWHAPRYRFEYTNEQIHSWFSSCGFDVIKTGSHLVNVLGRKRA